MRRWRKRLFLARSHLSAGAADHFALPRERTAIMGSLVEVRTAAAAEDRFPRTCCQFRTSIVFS